MRASGTFSVLTFVPTDVVPEPAVVTALPVGVARMEKSYSGAGTFNFVHSATTSGSDRSGEFFTVVPSSGAGELTGIRGTGVLQVDADGTHRVWFDYELG